MSYVWTGLVLGVLYGVPAVLIADGVRKALVFATEARRTSRARTVGVGLPAVAR